MNLAAHVRDELGMSDIASARPVQAAAASAASFSVGALLPLSEIYPGLSARPGTVQSFSGFTQIKVGKSKLFYLS
jgi:VIT1/CCC1 family predicted Fe2+/Mn2+ transporter